jgi:hypothetical protein
MIDGSAARLRKKSATPAGVIELKLRHSDRWVPLQSNAGRDAQNCCMMRSR